MQAEGRSGVEAGDERESGECEGPRGCGTEAGGHNAVLRRCEACFCEIPPPDQG